MEKPTDHVIGGLAAQANAAQWGAGVINPSFPKIGLTGTPRNSCVGRAEVARRSHKLEVDGSIPSPATNSPAVGGVRYHVAQYVGGAVVYSAAPNAPCPTGALTSRPPKHLSEVNPSLIFGLRAELPHDTGADCADGNKVRLPSLDKRAVGNGSLSEIFRQCLISRKPSQTLKHLDSYRFHCRKQNLTGSELRNAQEEIARFDD